KPSQLRGLPRRLHLDPPRPHPLQRRRRTAPGGKGFNHPVLNLANPLLAVELPTFMAAPGLVVPADGIMDTANNTTSGEVSYGLLGVEVAVDPDGPGGSAPTVTPVDSLFGVSSTPGPALGN